MADLIDLKRTELDKKSRQALLNNDFGEEEYAYGLIVDLGAEELDKLGIDKLEVGDEFEATVQFRVKSFSENSTDSGGRDTNASLLIKAIAMPKEEKEDAANVLFGETNGE